MEKRYTNIEFGGQQVNVLEGGYYDRYRMNPDLDEVARDPAAGNVDWFRRIPKQQVDSRVGRIWAPNFYYRTRNVQLLMLAPLERLRTMLPMPLEPLRAIPGYGLVALTFFSYSVCDNDPYNEVSVAVVVRQPGAKGSHALELINAMRRRTFHAHVLALPVDTEIARVRGVHGYQLPKWLADIDLTLGDDVKASIAGPTGVPDVAVTVPQPEFTDVPSQSHMGTLNSIHLVDGKWHQTAVQTNTLSYSQQLFPKHVELKRNGGPLSQLLDGLGVSRMIRLDVVRDAQMVLNLPAQVTAFEQSGR